MHTLLVQVQYGEYENNIKSTNLFGIQSKDILQKIRYMSSSYPNQPPTNPATAPGTRTRTWNISTNTLLGSVLTLAIAILIACAFGGRNIVNLFGFKRLLSRSLASGSGITTAAISSSLFSSAPTSGKPASGLRFESTMRTPVYFLSHGGVWCLCLASFEHC